MLWGLLAIQFFLLPFIFRKDGGSYMDRVKSDLRSYSVPKSPSPLSDSIDNKVLPTISLIFVLALVTFLIGKNFAKNGDEHWVLSDRPDMLMVRNYGDTMLLKRVSLSTRELTNTLEIVKISDSKNLDLKKVMLGISK